MEDMYMHFDLVRDYLYWKHLLHVSQLTGVFREQKVLDWCRAVWLIQVLPSSGNTDHGI